ncbi:hypothetical protein MMC20_001115 [Loxospora ochrophaea]|nr:hypothetical protein [Loxospora ochrophaea]
MSLTSKVALITGATKGIGRATALRLSALGAKIALNYSSDSAAADALVAEIGSDNALAIKADAGSVAACEAMVKATVDRFGRIDILIPNAGVLPMRDLEHTTEEDFDRTFGINVKGPYFLVQKALPHMPPTSHVVLLSTSLCHASTVSAPYLLYNATKGAIEQMVRVLAKDLATKGVNVNAVAPGPTGTELFLRGKSEQVVQMIGKASPYERLGAPEEIADAVAWLAGEGSRWVTGQVVRVNGGMV